MTCLSTTESSLTRRLWWAAVLLLLAPTGAALAAAPSPVEAQKAMVVSAHPTATRAGLDVLRDGGNAVDAAVTVAFALSVVEPYSSGAGGGSFSLYYDAEKKETHALDGRETAPAGLRPDHFRPGGTHDPELSRSGGLAVGVPGLVAAMVELHKKFGSRSLTELVAPAISMAGDGFTVTPLLARLIHSKADQLSPAAREVFMPGGKAPEPGERLQQRDLADTLARVAADGRDGFYKGLVADRVAAAVKEAGGVMTVEDIAGYKPVWREALKGEWRGMEVHTFPPPSSGGPVLLRMLHGVGRGADLTRAGWHSAAEVHVLVELMKRAYADRNLMLGDPDFVQVELERFTDPAAGRKDRKAVKRRATQAKRILNPKALVRESGGHTTHFSVVDAKGNAVSQTQTINLAFGSGLLAPGTGVLLNNEIDDFATAPGKPNAFDLVQGEANAVAPGKRPLSSMTPTILTKDGAVDAVVGSPGGSHIITAVFQVLLNHYLHGMDASEAVCAPRVHHQWLPDVIFADHFALSADTRAKLSSMRHKVEERRLMGNVQAIFKGSAGWTGGADCRGEGLAAGL